MVVVVDVVVEGLVTSGFDVVIGSLLVDVDVVDEMLSAASDSASVFPKFSVLSLFFGQFKSKSNVRGSRLTWPGGISRLRPIL